MPFMTRIPSDLARFGLKVELVPGWETRGSPAFAPACVVDHWTAGPRGTTGRPSLNICVNGRTGLPGPLCNVYLARNGVCVVVAAGRANHAGTGGFRGLVGNSAAYGIEAESGGDGDWTPEMLDAYPRLNAALLSGLGRDASWVCGHNEWTPRKIDIRDIIAAVRKRTAAVLANPGAAALTPGSGQSMPFGGETMSVAIAVAPNKTCWIDDGNKVWWTQDIKEIEALGKLWKCSAVPMADAEIQKCIDFRWRRKAEDRAADVAAIRAAMPEPNFTPEQIKAISEDIFEQIAPRLEDAQSLSEADFQAMLDSSEIDTVNLLATRLTSAA